MRSARTVLAMALGLWSLVCLTHCNDAKFSGDTNVRAAPAAPAVPITPPATVAVCSKNLAVSVVLDVSGSMTDEKIAAVQEGAKILLTALNPADYSSLTFFSEKAAVVAPMSQDHATTLSNLAMDKAVLPDSEGTDIGAGINAGYQQLMQASIPAGYSKILILLSDGQTNIGDSSQNLINNVKQGGDVTFFTILSSDYASSTGSQSPSDDPYVLEGQLLMQQLASSPQGAFQAQDTAGLQQAFSSIRQTLCTSP